MWHERWRWSSYAGYRSSKAALDWVAYERVLGEFGGTGAEARRRYCRFVEAGVSEPPRSPWKNALGGLLVGSESFAMRVRRLLADRQADQDVPQLERLRARPALDRIVSAVAEHYGCAADEWSSGRRSDGIARAVAAYLARRRFGCGNVARDGNRKPCNQWKGKCWKGRCIEFIFLSPIFLSSLCYWLRSL